MIMNEKTIYVNNFKFTTSNLDMYIEFFQTAPKFESDDIGTNDLSLETVERVRLVMPHALCKEMAEKISKVYRIDDTKKDTSKE